jgi:hypothetical protein
MFCFLGQKVCHYTHVNLRLLLPHESDGLRSELIEVGFQSLKELSAQTVACAFGATLRIAAMARLKCMLAQRSQLTLF